MLICADRAKPASVKRRVRERERNQSVVVTHSQFGHTQKTVVLTHLQTADPLLTGIVPLSLMSDPPFWVSVGQNITSQSSTVHVNYFKCSIER